MLSFAVMFNNMHQRIRWWKREIIIQLETSPNWIIVTFMYKHLAGNLGIGDCSRGYDKKFWLFYGGQ